MKWFSWKAKKKTEPEPEPETAVVVFPIPRQHAEKVCELYDKAMETHSTADRWRLWNYLYGIIPKACAYVPAKIVFGDNYFPTVEFTFPADKVPSLAELQERSAIRSEGETGAAL